MGAEGDLVIVNGTPYDWVKTGSHSYQMESWDFPDLIPPGKFALCTPHGNKKREI